jgi:hypothetical protein
VGTYQNTHPIQVSGIPLHWDIYYFFRLYKDLKLYVQGRAGLLWAKYVERHGRKLTQNTNYGYPEEFSASGRGGLVSAGLGLTYEFTSGISLFLEGSYRSAKIKDLTGENKTGEEGNLYAYEKYHADLDFWQERFNIFSEPPAGTDYRSVSKTLLDFTGFTARIGLFIRF